MTLKTEDIDDHHHSKTGEVPRECVPRRDLDVPERACPETLVELLRRRWTQVDIAAYIGGMTKADVRSEIEDHLSKEELEEYDRKACGATGRHSRLLWYADHTEYP